MDTIENVHLWMNTERGDVFRLGQLEQGTVETINMGGGNNYAEVAKGTITLTGDEDDTVRVGSAGENETAPNATLNLGNRITPSTFLRVRPTCDRCRLPYSFCRMRTGQRMDGPE